MQYGAPVVEACAKNGTHYVDWYGRTPISAREVLTIYSTGEIPWVLDMINKYHDIAQASGAIVSPHILTSILVANFPHAFRLHSIV